MTAAAGSPSVTHLQVHRRYYCHAMTRTDPLLGTHRPRYILRLHRTRLMMTTSRIQSPIAQTQDIAIVCT
ncbi:UNVERIFIED_CONTAM: hypothetical protein Sradi_7151300 [Sesamum radiatum]|uniref:Uncharacterized protein n=1 Tax=Sesamum radiatum TaxID=300843 RepID=A0AAW2IWS5_SESRA